MVAAARRHRTHAIGHKRCVNWSQTPVEIVVIDGTALTKADTVIACSDSLGSRIARGNAGDGCPDVARCSRAGAARRIILAVCIAESKARRENVRETCNAAFRSIVIARGVACHGNRRSNILTACESARSRRAPTCAGRRETTSKGSKQWLVAEDVTRACGHAHTRRA